MDKLILAVLSSIITIMAPVGNNISLIDREDQYDGPYIQYKGDQVLINYIVVKDGMKTVKTNSFGLREIEGADVKVMTDVPGKSFNVKLKNKLKTEKSEFKKANKMLVLSDIEGNFGAFRKLLQAGNVIDENLNWKFGDGHLVLIGDFFDRGQQVTEVLWLIYCLEEKAKATGGYVHFILGNHEIMNLTGDLRYVEKKYIENASLLNQKYETLYDENSELGRWLRTKNIVEKIGDILFTHGGISGTINSLNLSIRDLNTLPRPYYNLDTSSFADIKSATIFSDLGPFWYRGYYGDNPNVQLQIDSSLSKFGVNHIVTGHTIVADTISVRYNGKLLDTDVHHAAGKSEALLIENDKYYRLSPEGKRILLMQASQ